MEAAEEARDQGIKVYTVALGSSGESLYPLEGGGYAWLQGGHRPGDPASGSPSSPGGEEFPADDPAGLARGMAAINRLETTALPVDPPTEGRPLAPLAAPGGRACWPCPWPWTWPASAAGRAPPGWRPP